MPFYPKMFHVTGAASQAKVDGIIIRKKTGRFWNGTDSSLVLHDHFEEYVCENMSSAR